MFMHAFNCTFSTCAWQNRRENMRMMTTHQLTQQAQLSARHVRVHPNEGVHQSQEGVSQDGTLPKRGRPVGWQEERNRRLPGMLPVPAACSSNLSYAPASSTASSATSSDQLASPSSSYVGGTGHAVSDAAGEGSVDTYAYACIHRLLSASCHEHARLCTATHYCNMLQFTATHCNTLQHTATHCNTLQHAATCCNMLQHAATCCNSLQHRHQISF